MRGVSSILSSILAADPFSFSNLNDVKSDGVYVATLTAGDHDFRVQLDTGSSDLWLDTSGISLSGFQDTGAWSTIVYGYVAVDVSPER